jgi:hypothetical protein
VEKDFLTRTYAITVHGVQRIDGNQLADVEIIGGTGVAFGGEKAKRSPYTTNRFIMERAQGPHEEEYSIFHFEIGTYEVMTFILYVTHIDARSEEVHFILCVTEGRPTIIDDVLE